MGLKLEWVGLLHPYLVGVHFSCLLVILVFHRGTITRRQGVRGTKWMLDDSSLVKFACLLLHPLMMLDGCYVFAHICLLVSLFVWLLVIMIIPQKMKFCEILHIGEGRPCQILMMIQIRMLDTFFRIPIEILLKNSKRNFDKKLFRDCLWD